MIPLERKNRAEERAGTNKFPTKSLYPIPHSMDFYTNDFPPVYYLDATEAFSALTFREKEYVYACSQASWMGGLIDLIQTSPESAGVFLLVQKIFKLQSPDSFAQEARDRNFSDREIQAALSYFACVCANLGNYQNFGDTKFIPAIPQGRLAQLLSITVAFNDKQSDASALFSELSPAIYSLASRRLKLGFGPEDGISTYYSADCTKEDAEAAQVYLKAAKLEAYNTRLFKEPVLPDGKQMVSIRFACSDQKTVQLHDVKDIPANWILLLEYGDMAPLMELLVESSRLASSCSLNSAEAQMWQLYAESFKTGSVDTHKDASKIWITDKGPEVETYIGFIESYRDPLGVRAEFEGFVAIVNKLISAKFQRMVESAVEIISNLPWPPSYERDKFTKPDFTSLDVVTFASSGIPIGINIPNYDEIRETIGFKNVSLGNVLSARFKDPKTEFLADADKSVYLTNISTAYDIQVGLHELLGHGSGKLFRRNEDGTFNFDREETRDIFTGKPIEQWYEPGENWDNKFASLSSPMEECRAECVGIYLCDLPSVLKLFDISVEKNDDNVPDVVYVNWLSMFRSGVLSMEFYTPPQNAGDNGNWRQAHSCARYVIMRVLMEADNSMVRVDEVAGADGLPDLLISLDRAKIKSVAKPAIGEFLRRIQYYKSTGNAKDGGEFFRKYCELPVEHLTVRKIVIDRRRPRPVFAQPHFRRTTNGDISMVPYAPTYSGLIQSFVDRFAELPLGAKALSALETVWRSDQPYFKDIPI